ncbi:MAG TPA: hypothetical protein VD694_03815 [Nitrososphaeraceae archaeon]|nr:hypothetical protein [Nitrososphaeraceae archaeon]
MSEDGNHVGGVDCFKDDGGCKEVKEEFGSNVNKVSRESCESSSGGEKCKQEKIEK